MAIRNTKLVIKNSDIVNRPYSGATLLAGEAIVNTADGIVLFSGVTTSTNEWTPSGPGGNANFFEVGSNLYDLALRNRITKYEGAEGAGLVGKFLSGTTNGFILADTNLISGSFTSFDFAGDAGATNTINDGETQSLLGGTGISTSGSAADSLYINLDDTAVTPGSFGSATQVATFTVDQQGRLTAAGNTSILITASQVSDFTSASETAIFTAANFVDSSTIDFTVTAGDSVTADVLKVPFTLSAGTGISSFTFDGSAAGAVSIDTTVLTTGNTKTVENKSIDATTNTLTNLFRFSGDSGTVEVIDGNELFKIVGAGGIVTSSSSSNILTISAGTGNMTSFIAAGDSGANQTISDGDTLTISGGTGIDTIGIAGDFIKVDIDSTVVTLDGIQTLTNKTLTAPTINTSLTTDFLGTNRIVYTDGSQALTSSASATFDGTDMILPSTGSLTLGTGGLVVGSGGGPSTPGNGDVVIHGNLTIFGDAVTASTGELYIEDNTITLNYNPTGTTNATSLGSGFEIQDGDGAGVDLTWKVGELNTLDSGEYPATTGAANRAYYTNLNDIMIRQTTDTTSPITGKRVLAEDDVLDGGTY
jgi:hypothetical protein